jgi:RNA recognition motif-containing protein
MQQNGNNVYVASLPTEMSDAELMNLFAPFGIVMSAKIMREHKTRQSKGYGFVLYRDSGSAERAIRSLNNQVMGSTTLHVRHAHTSASQDLTKLCRPLPQCQQPRQMQLGHGVTPAPATTAIIHSLL